MIGSILMILVNKLEKVKLPAAFGYCCILALLALDFVSIVKGVYFLSGSLPIVAALFFIFTKKSKFFGARTAMLSFFLGLIIYSRLLYSLLPKGESKWYGDCLMTDNGNTEVQGFFSLVLAFLTYYVTKYLIYKFTFNRNKSFVVSILPDSKTSFDRDLGCKEDGSFLKNRFLKFLAFLSNFSLPHKFGMGLFVICALGHVFFGFTNAYLYNACEDYNHFNNVSNPVCSIYSWHIMDILLFYVSILFAIFSFKARYNGAVLVRFCTFLVFLVLNLVLGYVYNLKIVSLVAVFSVTVIFYAALRFIVLRLLRNKMAFMEFNSSKS